MDVQDCFSVIFHNVKEYYSPDNVINCQFSVKENAVFNQPAECFVGIFVVAWDSLDNAIAKKSFTSIELKSTSGTIYDLTFDPKDIPNSYLEDDEFYQFCFYDTETKDVFGASCPFQICHFREESLVHIDNLDTSNDTSPLFLNSADGEMSWWLKESSDKPVYEDLEDKDTVLIHNKTTLMENALNKAEKDKEEAIMATQQKFETELKQFSSENKVIIEKSEAEISHLKQLNQSLTEREQLLKQNLVDSQNVVRQMEKFAEENSKKTEILLQNLTIEKEALVKALTDKEVENMNHINQLKAELNAKIESSEVRCDALNQSLMAEKRALEKMQIEFEETVQNLKLEIELMGIKESESVNETSRTLADLQAKLNNEITLKYEYLSEIENLSQSVTKLNDEIKSKDNVISNEREKLATLSFQQQEMTSRLSAENEKICAEIQNFKSHENSLVEAHQKELAYHRNRIAEVESISKEEKIKLKTEIDQLNNELNDKINCINILEAKIRESSENVLHIETLQEENMKLNDTVDELKTRLGSLEHEHLHLPEDLKSLPRKTSESGSMHALHIANAHMQKQLNCLKKEKEMHSCQSTKSSVGDLDDILRENEEFKLRLCMGKKAFDKQYMECQRLRNELNRLKLTSSTCSNSSISDAKDTSNDAEYNSLLLEYNNLKASHTKRVHELLSELQKSNEQKNEGLRELAKIADEKDTALKLNEELRMKLLQLVDHYEGKINLLIEENGNLKIQRTALMAGAGTSGVEMKQSSPDIVQTVASVNCEQPNLIQMNRDVIPKTDRKKKEMSNSQDFTIGKSRITEVVNRQPPIGKSTVVSHPPASKEKVVLKQPTLLPNIMYPPSMKPPQIHRAYPTEPQQICRSPTSEIATPVAVNDPFVVSDPLISAEPPSQMIPNRTSPGEQVAPHGCGKLGSYPIPYSTYDNPTQKCPMCDLDFPANLTEGAKTEHVNSHFD